jgi:predicted DNA-binding transcriptional regulator AlpA
LFSYFRDAILGICTRTADRWHTFRTGPPRTRVGRKILYRKSAIAEWLKGKEQDRPAVRR